MCPLRRSRCRAGNSRVLIGVPTHDLPIARNAAIHSNFEAIRALAAGLNDPGWIVRVSRSGVGTVQLIQSGRQKKGSKKVPLRTHLVVTKLLRLERLRN